MSAAAEVSSRIERPDGIRRLGQALWMMVGHRVEQGALLWARALLGANGDSLLWQSLCEEGAVREPGFELRPQPLANFLCRLWGNEPDIPQTVRLVWTLPPQLNIDGVALMDMCGRPSNWSNLREAASHLCRHTWSPRVWADCMTVFLQRFTAASMC